MAWSREWRPGTPFERDATCASTPTSRSIAADIDRILEAGWRAPSASNRQKWDFVVVTDRDQLAELGTVWQGARHIPGSQATIVLTVVEPEAERYLTIDQYDLGQATMAMMIAAADLGIGSGHSSVGDQDAARRILGVPEGTPLLLHDRPRPPGRSPAASDRQARPPPVRRGRPPRHVVTPGGSRH